MEDIAIGAAVLGTGGGGDPYLGKVMAVEAIRRCGPVQLISIEEVPLDALTVLSAGMGAPTILVEKLFEIGAATEAFLTLEKYLGTKVYATMSAEIGGANSIMPLVVAAELGIPVVDADTMGRAFPELQMVIPTLYGISATPMAIADEKGNSAILNTINNKWSETFARSITIDMGAMAMIALYALTGEQLREAVVPDTMTLAEEVGWAIRETRGSTKEIVDAILNITKGYLIFKGKIIDVQRRTVAGFARGEAIFEGTDEYAGRTLKIEFQNEHLVAEVDGQIVVSVPDLITILDAETAQPITTEALRYGFRVVVLGLPCTSKWRTPEGLALVGPRYFGYDIDYVPVEERFGGH
ncbi:MAG: DUF917 domain-containing protein [Anaerolineae bacterium]